MSIPQFSPDGAMPASSDEFMEAYRLCDNTIMFAIKAFEATTGRVVRDVTLKWEDVTRLMDTEARHVRLATIDWLPTKAEIDLD